MADPHDLAALNNFETENVDTHDAWICIQKGRKGCNTISASSCHDSNLLEDWLKEARSPNRSSVLTSLNLFQETGEDTKSLPYSVCITEEPSLKLANHTEETKKPERSNSSYRLFGFDLFNQPNSLVSREKVTATLPLSKTVGPIELELPSAKLSISLEDLDQTSALSKASKEQSQVHQDNSKELNGRQSGSARSCTKVNE